MTDEHENLPFLFNPFPIKEFILMQFPSRGSHKPNKQEMFNLEQSSFPWKSEHNSRNQQDLGPHI